MLNKACEVGTVQTVMLTTRATNFIILTKIINKFHADLKATMGKPIK